MESHDAQYHHPIRHHWSHSGFSRYYGTANPFLTMPIPRFIASEPLERLAVELQEPSWIECVIGVFIITAFQRRMILETISKMGTAQIRLLMWLRLRGPQKRFQAFGKRLERTEHTEDGTWTLHQSKLSVITDMR
jgi:hypothetical protein